MGKVTAEYKEEYGSGVFIRTFFSDAAGKEDEIVQIHEIRHDLKTGIVHSESYRSEEGHLHRQDGAASITRSMETGRLVNESWKQNGEYYRDPPSLPVDISRNRATGEVERCFYISQKTKVRLIDDNHTTPSGKKKTKYRVAEPHYQRV